MRDGFEAVPCPVCGSPQWKPAYTLPDLAYHTPGPFHLVTCGACGHLYQSPRPGPGVINQFYPTQYDPFRPAIEEQTASPALRWLRHRQLRTRCSQVFRLATSGRLLDIGCSTGLFLNEMRRYGQWDLHGVELNPTAACYARHRFGLDVHEGQLESADFGDLHFDIITLWDVLEHLPDPRAALARISALLASGGQVVLSVPNLDGVDARIFGPWWTGLDPPRHFSAFRRRDLARLLAENGLQADRMYCFYGRYTTFAASLRLLLRARIAGAPFERGLERVAGLGVWRYVTLPYFAAVDQLGRGAILTIVASRA
jgi:2-polyprenyl-3-methyl-5-hydroxy-6-metoxy-1,4-benzoquinol methylase